MPRGYVRRYSKTSGVPHAALFALAESRKEPLAAAFTISDSLADLKWRPEFHSKETQQGLEGLYQAGLVAF